MHVRERLPRRDGLDPPNSGAHRALGEDHERPDLRRRANVSAATELARKTGDLDHADDLRVLLSEEHHRAEVASLVDRREERMHRQVLEDPLVHDFLDPLALLRSQRLGMSEVEAELVRANRRPSLANVVAEHLLERLVQEVRGRVIGHRRETHLPGNHRFDAIAGSEALAAEEQRLVLTEAEGAGELGSHSVLLDPAPIAHLTAALGVERRLAELDEKSSVAEGFESPDLRQDFGLLPTDEVGCKSGFAGEVGCSLDLRLVPAGARDLPVLLHQSRKAIIVDREAAFARELPRQLDRKAVCRRQDECVLAGDSALGGHLLEEAHAPGERLREALLLGPEGVLDLASVLLQLRVPGRGLRDDHVREAPEILEPDLASLLDGAPDDPA